MAYVIRGNRSGTIRFTPDTGTVQSETETRSSKMTSNAIESGSEINDHVVKNPEQFQIAGILVGGQRAEERLKNMWERKELLTYEGRCRKDNLVILNLQIKRDSKNRDGCSFSASLQVANISNSMYVEIGHVPMMAEEDGKGKDGVKKAGLTTTSKANISQNAYVKYVESYNGSYSNGPTARKQTAYNGR